MTEKTPDKSRPGGITTAQLVEMFPDEESALKWFQELFWPDGRRCGHCGSTRTIESSHAQMPFWCSECRSYFSIKTGTFLSYSQLSLRNWVFAIFMHRNRPDGISGMQLHREIGVPQKTAWYMLKRLRMAFDDNNDGNDGSSDGPVTVG